MRNEVTMEAVLTPENLRAAYLTVRANAGAAGVDRMEVGEIKTHWQTHGEAIVAKLREGKYRPSAVRAVEIPKANGS